MDKNLLLDPCTITRYNAVAMQSSASDSSSSSSFAFDAGSRSSSTGGSISDIEDDDSIIVYPNSEVLRIGLAGACKIYGQTIRKSKSGYK